MRSRFEDQLTQLGTELTEMGAMVEQAIEHSVKALVERDMDVARRVIANDEEVNKKERDIESLCLKLLLQQQPVARDLRQISAALKMITDMERIGDQAADISEIVLSLGDEPYIKKLEHLPLMAEETIKMVRSSIDAYVRRDLQLARAVLKMDDAVDELFLIIKTELIGIIAKNQDTGGQALDLLMIAKYFERIGDHAENIAEWVEYSLTGIHKGNIL